ncbi:MAG: hypothetical protein K1Y02_11770 [Candidatus Hydrogenedentes bacterium]|nr:hypothetical protein [Candidatus Hydrogenedentota bacterium]
MAEVKSNSPSSKGGSVKKKGVIIPMFTAKKQKKAVQKKVKALSDNTVRRATKLALNLVDFQKTTFDNTIRVFTALQEQTEKLIQELTVKSTWMPKEGKKVVEEWIKTVNRSRNDFKKTMDRSFDLISAYLKRVQEDESAKAKPAKPKAKAKVKAKAKPRAKAKAKVRPKAPAPSESLPSM